MENPNLKWMIYMGTPISGNHQIDDGNPNEGTYFDIIFPYYRGFWWE